MPAGSLIDRETRRLLDPAQLTERLGPLLENERVVLYCGGGIAAAADALALTLLGHQRVAIYDGSLAEWAADPDAELTLAG